MLLYFTLLQIAGAGFPEDSEPISISHSNCEYICISYFSSIYIFSLRCPPCHYSLFSCTLSLLFHASHFTNPLALALSPLFQPFFSSQPPTSIYIQSILKVQGVIWRPRIGSLRTQKNGGLKAAFETEPTPHQRIIPCFPIGPLMLCDSLNSVVGCADTLIVSSRLTLCCFSLSCRILLSLVPNASQSQKSGNKELANLTHTCHFRRLGSSLRTH